MACAQNPAFFAQNIRRGIYRHQRGHVGGQKGTREQVNLRGILAGIALRDLHQWINQRQIGFREHNLALRPFHRPD